MLLAENAPALSLGQALPTPVRARSRLGPLATAAVVIYGSLALVALAVPGSLVSALREMQPNALTRAALPLAERLEAASISLGVAPLYTRAKAAFRAISCGGPHSADPC